MSRAAVTTSDIRSSVFRLGLPAAAAMFAGTLYAPIDLWCAGRLGTDAVVAVSFAAPLLFVLMAFSVGLAQAATSLVARRLGAGDVEAARLIWAHALWLALGVGVVLMALGISLAPLMLTGQGATADVLRRAGEFSLVIFAGAPAFLLVASINAALLAEGDGRPNFWFLTLGCLANLGLNFILMRIWGVAGLAAATVLVQVGGLVGLFLIARGRGWRLRGLGSLNLPIFGELVRQAAPNVLNMLMIPVAVFLVTRQVAMFGRDAVAAYGFALRIEHLFSMPLIGFVSSVLPLASRARGAGDLGAAFRTWLVAVGLAFVASLVFALLLACLAPDFAGYSGLTGPAHAYLGRYLVFAAVALPAYPVLFSVVFFMQALGRPEYGMWMGLARHCLAPLLILPFCAGWFGLQGVWIAITGIAWAAAIVAFGLAMRGRRLVG
jgi:putative MATE family efflux protein